MSNADRMLLSPYQKLKKYYRVPWKAVLHILLFLVVLTQVILTYVEQAKYTRAQFNTFDNIFIKYNIYPSLLFIYIMASPLNLFFLLSLFIVVRGQKKFQPRKVFIKWMM